MAIVLPVLLLLLGGAIDLGRAYFSSISLENAVKEGALFGARAPECATDAVGGCADPRNVEARLTVELHGITASAVEVKCFAPGTVDFSSAGKALADCADGDLYYVRAQVPFALVTPLLPAVVGSPITLTADATAVVVTSFQQAGGSVTFPSATPIPTPGPGTCTVPDFTAGPTKINNAKTVWSTNAGFVEANLTPVGPGGQNVSWQSLPPGTEGECSTTTIMVSNTPQGTPAPTASPTPSATPTPTSTPASASPSPTLAPTATPVPTGNCTVPDMRDVVITVAHALWTQAGFQPANFSAHRGPPGDYIVKTQNVDPGLSRPCLTTTVQVKK